MTARIFSDGGVLESTVSFADIYVIGQFAALSAAGAGVLANACVLGNMQVYLAERSRCTNHL